MKKDISKVVLFLFLKALLIIFVVFITLYFINEKTHGFLLECLKRYF